MMTTKGVSFNLGNEEQTQLHDYACKQGNFSGYVKDLIKKDKAAKERKPLSASGGIKITL
jgi:hypothetical protein